MVKRSLSTSLFISPITTVFVKDIAIRPITVESVSGTFATGDTLTKGTGGNTTTATVYFYKNNIIYVGPSTINGSGSEFAAGDSVTSGSATATVSSGGVGSAVNEFVFQLQHQVYTYSLALDGGLHFF